jgi:O-antigen ligase
MSSIPVAAARPIRRAARALPKVPAVLPCAAGFVCFVLVNAALFIRPGEVVPAFLGWEIYQFVILAALIFTLPVVVAQLDPRLLELRPITVCILGLFPFIVLSNLVHGRPLEAFEGGKEFLKIALYYLLFVGLVISPGRLRRFLWWLGIFASVSALLAVLHYHNVITLPSAIGAKETNGVDAQTGVDVVIVRLTGTGVFHDPNDFCILLVVSIFLAFYWLTDRRSGVGRLLWLAPLGLFLYALSLTHSRGGLLALLVGVLALLQARFGWRRAGLLMLLVLPAVFIALAGRQTEFSATSGTGQDRLQLWRDGVVLFKQSPLFGIGQGEYTREAGQVAHNSYLQAFTELGFFGGTLFLGAAALALGMLYRIRNRSGHTIVDPTLRRMHPYLMGMVAGYAGGMMTLTLSYIVPTYTVFALSSACTSIARTTPATPPVRFDTRLMLQLCGLSVLALAGFHVVVRVFAH